MKAVLELNQVTKVVDTGLNEQKTILDQVDLTIYEQDFITILGGNGAGKSTLFNIIAGTLPVTSGSIYLLGENVTTWSAQKRAKYLSRVFQDPKMGTAPRMTVAENLLIATQRGYRPRLLPRRIKQQEANFKKLLAQVGNGLDKHLETPTGHLSGGQRQALSLLMATIQSPQLLLLDEHTAALDPKTSLSLMQLTNQLVSDQARAALMITHQMEDALAYGNRLLVMKEGRIIKDFSRTEKAEMSLSDYYHLFE